MIIGNLAGAAPYGSRTAHGASAPGSAGNNATAHSDDGGAASAPSSGTQARIVYSAPPVPDAGEGDGQTVSPQQTARIVALVASMSRTDDISAYSIVGRGGEQTDEFKHVVSAYQSFSD